MSLRNGSHSKLSDSAVKDFVDYISSADEHAMDAFRKLLYDFLDAEKVLQESIQISQCIGSR